MNSYALQEVAGKVILKLNPGEKQTFSWGLLSDDNSAITVSLSATGEGSKFLSFPESVTLSPQKIVYVSVDVNVPPDYSGKSELTPILSATQQGEQGGPTVLNIQVQKIVTMDISTSQSNSAVPEFPSVAGIIFAIAILSVIVTIRSKPNLIQFSRNN